MMAQPIAARSALAIEASCQRCDSSMTIVLALPCDRCGGIGMVYNPHWEEDRTPEEIDCPTCRGHGFTATETGRTVLEFVRVCSE